jgi:hypothetical protein
MTVKIKIYFFILNHCPNFRVHYINSEISIIEGDSPQLWYLSTSCNDLEPVLIHKLGLSVSWFHETNIKDDARIELIKSFSENYFLCTNEYLKYNIAINLYLNGKGITPAKGNYSNFMKLNINGGINECEDYIMQISDQLNAQEIIVCPIFDSYSHKIETINSLAEHFF